MMRQIADQYWGRGGFVERRAAIHVRSPVMVWTLEHNVRGDYVRGIMSVSLLPRGTLHGVHVLPPFWPGGTKEYIDWDQFSV